MAFSFQQAYLKASFNWAYLGRYTPDNFDKSIMLS